MIYAALPDPVFVGDDMVRDDAEVLLSAYSESVAMSKEVGRAFRRMRV